MEATYPPKPESVSDAAFEKIKYMALANGGPLTEHNLPAYLEEYKRQESSSTGPKA